MGRRLLALAWTVTPDYYEEAPSLAQIAKDIGCTRAALSIHSAQARRQFGIRNRLAVHGWNYRDRKEAEGPLDVLASTDMSTSRLTGISGVADSRLENARRRNLLLAEKPSR